MPDMVKLAKPVEIPIGWSTLAVEALSTLNLWTVIRVPSSSSLWVRGTTHYAPPFMIETMTEDQLKRFFRPTDAVVVDVVDSDEERS
eukprot:5097042-Amphidinium_carterae.1